MDRVQQVREQIACARQRAYERHLASLREEVLAALGGPPAVGAAVYLFGSWATGRFDGQSDTDLLAIVSDRVSVQEAEKRLMSVADDVVAMTRGEWERHLREGNTFFQRIRDEARLLVDTGEVGE